MRMNFSLFDEEGKTLNVGEGCYVKLQGTETSYAKVDYGCFELPPGFEGEVEIPFEVLAFGDTGEKAEDAEDTDEENIKPNKEDK